MLQILRSAVLVALVAIAVPLVAPSEASADSAQAIAAPAESEVTATSALGGYLAARHARLKNDPESFVNICLVAKDAGNKLWDQTLMVERLFFGRTEVSLRAAEP